MDQLDMYVRAGLSIDQALRSMEGSVGSRNIPKLLRVSESVQSGRSLSVALSEEFPLPSAVRGLIDSGESSGTLADTLSSCKSLLERQEELVKKSISALVYPCVIGIATLGLTIGLIEGIMPQIIPLLTSLHAQLPLLTRIVMWGSRFTTSYWIYMVIGSSGFAFLVSFLYRTSMRTRHLVHWMMLRIPIAGTLTTKYSMALFYESLGSMIIAGIPMTSAFSRALNSIAVLPIREKFRQKSEPLIRGAPCSSIAEVQLRGAPRYAVSMLVAGESSGTLGMCMRRISSMLDKDLEHALKRLTALLEPVMMIAMGGIVGSIALSIMLPIYDISKALQR